MTAKWALIFASLSGFFTVVLGAFAAHGLKHRLDQYAKGIWETAVQYQMFHTLVLLVVGLLLSQAQFSAAQSLKVSAVSFLIGIIIFSGSLYTLALTNIKWLGAVTPLGGLAFLVGWAALLWFAIKAA
ncbi:DUF423 domain-containing protein [Pleionea mediterranea]|uniref:Uncharacterized membrane protein YgdD (TMEM256/DUF423 family) n=1 Tax=Pleionea mediterranea TaxID=523701 RepID=A0A316G121_9GAMM|nr:DUF423 domain-containing protein [Pleionea mediterranea]PWK53666.1 uncharacterized membrane protein YgdD (TMEM256/DUF423 family) [Pleionea mediterranea]